MSDAYYNEIYIKHGISTIFIALGFLKKTHSLICLLHNNGKGKFTSKKSFNKRVSILKHGLKSYSIINTIRICVNDP